MIAGASLVASALIFVPVLRLQPSLLLLVAVEHTGHRLLKALWHLPPHNPRPVSVLEEAHPDSHLISPLHITSG
jgi:hypothetical protein